MYAMKSFRAGLLVEELESLTVIQSWYFVTCFGTLILACVWAESWNLLLLSSSWIVSVRCCSFVGHVVVFSYLPFMFGCAMSYLFFLFFIPSAQSFIHVRVLFTRACPSRTMPNIFQGGLLSANNFQQLGGSWWIDESRSNTHSVMLFHILSLEVFLALWRSLHMLNQFDRVRL